jgi:hypothetical protein
MDAGIRNNDIEPSHRFFGFAEQPPHVGGFRNISLNRYRLAALPENLIHHPLCQLFIPTVIDNNRGAVGGKTLGDRFANTA